MVRVKSLNHCFHKECFGRMAKKTLTGPRLELRPKVLEPESIRTLNQRCWVQIPKNSESFCPFWKSFMSVFLYLTMVSVSQDTKKINLWKTTCKHTLILVRHLPTCTCTVHMSEETKCPNFGMQNADSLVKACNEETRINN